MMRFVRANLWGVFVSVLAITGVLAGINLLAIIGRDDSNFLVGSVMGYGLMVPAMLIMLLVPTTVQQAITMGQTRRSVGLGLPVLSLIALVLQYAALILVSSVLQWLLLGGLQWTAGDISLKMIGAFVCASWVLAEFGMLSGMLSARFGGRGLVAGLLGMLVLFLVVPVGLVATGSPVVEAALRWCFETGTGPFLAQLAGLALALGLILSAVNMALLKKFCVK